MLKCNRCGARLTPEELGANSSDIFNQVGYFKVMYRGLSDGVWRVASFCESCQKDLRKEFYQRGLQNQFQLLDEDVL